MGDSINLQSRHRHHHHIVVVAIFIFGEWMAVSWSRKLKWQERGKGLSVRMVSSVVVVKRCWVRRWNLQCLLVIIATPLNIFPVQYLCLFLSHSPWRVEIVSNLNKNAVSLNFFFDTWNRLIFQMEVERNESEFYCVTPFAINYENDVPRSESACSTLHRLNV